MPAEAITVRDLRRSWKPHKERLNGHDAEHSTNVRFHRACSWLQRAEEASKDDLDVALLSQWIAFNALYGAPKIPSYSQVPESPTLLWQRRR